MSSPSERWVVFVRVDDQSGTLTALAQRFSSRGITFESFSTLTVSGGVGVMSIIFRGSERLARVLVRTLERLTVVRAVTLERTEDPRVRAIAMIDAAPGGEPSLPPGVISHRSGESTVLSGPLDAVEQALEHARSDGQAVAALTVIPPHTLAPDRGRPRA